MILALGINQRDIGQPKIFEQLLERLRCVRILTGPDFLCSTFNAIVPGGANTLELLLDEAGRYPRAIYIFLSSWSDLQLRCNH